jgi:hypothetical protein
LRPEKVGSDHARDHVDVSAGPSQVPAAHSAAAAPGGQPGATNELLDWLSTQGRVRGRRLESFGRFSQEDMALACAIIAIPDRAWTPAVMSTASSGGRCGRRGDRRHAGLARKLVLRAAVIKSQGCLARY